MNKRQRTADSDMRYLGKAWRAGFYGPREHPKSTSVWQQMVQQVRHVPFLFNEDRITELNDRWLRVASRHRYAAAVLKLHYRDGYKFSGEKMRISLDLFSRA